MSSSQLRVLGLASYPIEAAATRYRLMQFIEPLAKRGIQLEVHPLLTSSQFATLYRPGNSWRTASALLQSAFRRLGDIVASGRFDVLLVQREAMILGPPVVEWMITKLRGLPMVLDLDDATYIPYVSPTYGHLGRLLKWTGKTDRLIRLAKAVTCGSPAIADHVSRLGTPTSIIPTVVDTDRFCPRPSRKQATTPVIGWIGSHSTFPYLQSIFPVLQRLATEHKFRLKIIGAGRSNVELPGVDVEFMDWDLGREVEDFQSIDIGLYPIVADEWSVGKSGFKAIQYMSVGVPYVMSPVGVCAGIGEVEETHFTAANQEEWHHALSQLLANQGLGKAMGAAGRRYALQHYTVPQQAEKLAVALSSTFRSRSP